MKNYDGNMIFDQKPHIASYASVVGKKEGEGPLRDYFDRIIHDSYAGKDTFEQAESAIMSDAVQRAMDKGGFTEREIDLACCGDLLNQCVASSFAMRSYGIPYAGVYGACSTMALSMILSAIALESGAARRAVCAASSHYCTAERQYRFPLEYGSQRPPTAQWTVTGAGACVIERRKPSVSRFVAKSAETAASPARSVSEAFFTKVSVSHSVAESVETASSPERSASEVFPTKASVSRSVAESVETAAASEKSTSKAYPTRVSSESTWLPYLHSARLGRIIDYNITNQNNMGAAMAPAIVK